MPRLPLILDTNPGFPGFVRYGAASFARSDNSDQAGLCSLVSGSLCENFPAGKFSAEETSRDLLPVESTKLKFKLAPEPFLQESFPRWPLGTGLIGSRSVAKGGQGMSATQ